MPYSGFAVKDVAVLFDSSPGGVASITHDERARLTISVSRNDPWDALLTIFGPPERPTITSPTGASPSIRVESAVHTHTDDNVQRFEAHEAFVTDRVPPATADVGHRYYLTGLDFVGNRLDLEAGGVRWSLDLLDRSDETAPVDGYQAVTATLSSEPVKASRAGELEEIASTVLLLASFAAGGEVYEVRRDQMLDGAIVTRRLRVNRRASMFMSPLALGVAPPGTLALFIKSCYAHAVSVQRTLPLRQMIRILLHLRGESVVQTMGLLVAHFLEVLRFHYALRVLCPTGRALRKGRDFFRDAAAKKKHRKLSFTEVLTDFCTDHRITRWRSNFRTFRNRMFHGLDVPGQTLLDQYQHVMDVADFCDAVILALLNWDASGGRYVPCNRPAATHTVSKRGRGGLTAAVRVNIEPFVR
jgi:hypothetical protein